jgi:hypothetical protein
MKFKLLILDFDDTLFPSCVLKTNQNLHPRETVEIDNAVNNLIIKYISLDFHIVIITNSQIGWYNMISEKFLPKFSTLVKNCSIRVISANDIYNCIYPYDFIKWKICAYEDYLLQHLLIDGSKGHVPSNIKFSEIYVISVGDSQVDMFATSYLTRGNVGKLCNLKTKFIKYQDNPTIKIILDQTNFLIDKASLLYNLTQPVTLYVDLPDPFNIPNQHSPNVSIPSQHSPNVSITSQHSPNVLITIQHSPNVSTPNQNIIYQPRPLISTQNTISNDYISNDTIFEFSDLDEPRQEILSPPSIQNMDYGEKIFQEIFFTKPISTEPYF